MPQGVKTNQHTISNKFNSYFTTIAQNLVSENKTTNFVNIWYFDQQVQISSFLIPSLVKNQVLYM